MNLRMCELGLLVFKLTTSLLVIHLIKGHSDVKFKKKEYKTKSYRAFKLTCKQILVYY